MHVHRSPGGEALGVVVGAEGSWLTMGDGSRLLDLHGQYMSMGVGHRHPRIQTALHEAIDNLGYCVDLFAHEGKGRAAKLLIEDTMEGSDWAGRVRFVASGTEAVETALLMARIYTGRQVVVTRQLAHHGWTEGAAAVSTSTVNRGDYFDLPEGRVRNASVQHAPIAPAPFCASCPLGLSPESCKDENGTLACVRETERTIRAVGVHNVAGFITELYNAAGAYMVPEEYPAQIREMTTRLGIVWIDDEVVAGVGRTGKWWAFQHYGVTPDIVVAGKGLSSSAAPVGACIISRELSNFFDTGIWTAAGSFHGHPLSVAAVAATIEAIIEDDLVAHAAELGEYVRARLTEMTSAHMSLAYFEGSGLAWILNFVDPSTGRPWTATDRWYDVTADGDTFKPSEFLTTECAKRGVLLFPFLPNSMHLGPPLTITREELDFGLAVLDEALGVLDIQASAVVNDGQ
ncbi:aspartate aminotransferase family protein [Rhodococcus erythropolis]|uniref:aspartate aminotransferase family protein n=1 Tax=Rhodococcus erythropolis TaxID=1833 RepID=UPI001D1716C8|nr:aspartate aminotransferase family protein [Rhodococcus erythropolis]